MANELGPPLPRPATPLPGTGPPRAPAGGRPGRPASGRRVPASAPQVSAGCIARLCFCSDREGFVRTRPPRPPRPEVPLGPGRRDGPTGAAAGRWAAPGGRGKPRGQPAVRPGQSALGRETGRWDTRWAWQVGVHPRTRDRSSLGSFRFLGSIVPWTSRSCSQSASLRTGGFLFPEQREPLEVQDGVCGQK